MEKGFRTTALGVMSGTSLDGLDLSLAEFSYDEAWSFSIISAHCVEYDQSWKERLGNAHQLTEQQLQKLDNAFGSFIGQQIEVFLETQHLPLPDLVCSHGHTVIHEPAKGVTLQIGDGQRIANMVKSTCVSDFRSLDVSLGGQGAPLVPIGDKLLFHTYDACLNLGGFSNISFKKLGNRIAFDICPVNIILNRLTVEIGKPYDENGDLAHSGTLDENLFNTLNKLEVYSAEPRPSLAREWLEHSLLPPIDASSSSTVNKISTVTEHAAYQIADVLNEQVKHGSVLITGGGAKNGFLLERIAALSNAKLVIPEQEIIDFKEALTFGFLGVLKILGQTNVLKSVTGARTDSCSGVIHHPSA